MSDTLLDPLLGRLIDGRYEVRERIAAGGMATVYMAFDRRLERDVALKIMHNSLADATASKEFVARFRREAKSAARLTHPGLVRVYDQGVDGNISYLTMEFVRGETLRERLNQEGTVAVGEALAIGEAVLDALAAAHREHLVHRDIKPENILIDSDGRPRVADFGLARAVTEVTATASGTVLGTVAYLGPELVSRGHADARTDIYAVGIVLFEMLTGRQPFSAPSAIELASKHVHEDVPPPSSYVPWLPPEIDHLVSSLVARDPQARPEDAVAALSILRQTRAMVDDPTLDRQADPPSGTIPIQRSVDDNTEVLAAYESGSTVALPIGLGEPLPDLAVIEAEVIDDDPEAQDPLVAAHKLGLWIGAIIAAVLALSALGLWWYNSAGPGAYTTVPPVANNPELDALQILQSVGLETEVEYAHHDEIVEGIVITTDPPAQTQVLNGSEVTVIVSRGPRMENVPLLEGLDETEAIAALREAGFPVGEVTRVFHDTEPAGTVLSQSHAPALPIRHDTPIGFAVSDGPEPISIPDVTGRSEEAAISILEVYALEVTVVRERTLEETKGRVFKQDPAGNADGFRTQAVTIYVSDGPPQVEVPDFMGMTIEQAREVASEVGLLLDEVRIPGFWPDRKVVSQDPSPGVKMDVGSTVRVAY